MVNNYISLHVRFWSFDLQVRFLALWFTKSVFRSFGFRVQIYGIFVYAAFCYVTFVFFYVSHTKMCP